MANKYNFEFELSNSSIQGLIRELSIYQKDLVNSKTYILQALADYTHERVVYHIANSVGNTTGKYVDYMPTDNLINNIKVSKIIDDMVRVIADTEYAKYVEYGTGIEGAKNPHIKASEAGWEYSDGSWVYHASDGNFYRTEGLPAHNFMYNAWLDLKENYKMIMKQVLRERGLLK